MNKSYRSIYNEATGAWVAVSETTSARGKKSSGKKAAVAAVIALHLAVSGSAYAANAGLAGGTNVGTTGTGMGTTNANHQAVTLSGDDDYCGSMNIAGRTNVAGGHTTTAGITPSVLYSAIINNSTGYAWPGETIFNTYTAGGVSWDAGGSVSTAGQGYASTLVNAQPHGYGVGW